MAAAATTAAAAADFRIARQSGGESQMVDPRFGLQHLRLVFYLQRSRGVALASAFTGEQHAASHGQSCTNQGK